MSDSIRLNKKLTGSRVVTCFAAVLSILVGVGSIIGGTSFVIPMAPVLQYAEAQIQEHGLALAKVCNKVIVGSNNDCFFTTTNIDAFNDTIRVLDVRDIMLTPYPGAPVAHSARSDPGFSIVAVADVAPFGDTTCVVGPIVPPLPGQPICDIGHDDRVRFHDASFTMYMAQ